MLGEVAPFLVPQFDALLVTLLGIAAALVCLGILTVLHGVARAVVGGIGGILGHVPYLGHVLASPVNRVYHWMNHEFAVAELAVDKLLARFLHSLASLTHWIGSEIGQLGKLFYITSTVLLGSTATEALTRLSHLIAQRVTAVEHAAEHALHRITTLERSVASKAIAAVHPLLRPLEHAIDVTIPYDLRALRERAHGLTDRLEHAWTQIRKLDALLGTAAITAAVAVALSRLGLGWTRCSNVKRLGRGLCGLPSNLIEALFAGAIDALVLGDLCDLSYLMTLSAEEIRPVFLEWVDVEEALVGCHGNTAPPALKLPPLDLPPAVSPLELAA